MNIVLNTILHISSYNSIERPTNVASFNYSSDKLLALLKEDVISARGIQNNIEDTDEKINNILNTSSVTFTYNTYNLMRQISVNNFKVNSAYEKFFGNFNMYFFLENYSLSSQDRLFVILNPVKFAQTDLLQINELESRFLEILDNGIALAVINEKNSHIILDFIKSFMDYFRLTMIYVNVSAVFFTIIMCIILTVYFMKLFEKQNETFMILSKVDIIHGVKVNIVCDKLLDVLCNSDAYLDGENKYINFYSTITNY